MSILQLDALTSQYGVRTFDWKEKCGGLQGDRDRFEITTIKFDPARRPSSNEENYSCYNVARMTKEAIAQLFVEIVKTHSMVRTENGLFRARNIYVQGPVDQKMELHIMGDEVDEHAMTMRRIPEINSLTQVHGVGTYDGNLNQIGRDHFLLAMIVFDASHEMRRGVKNYAYLDVSRMTNEDLANLFVEIVQSHVLRTENGVFVARNIYVTKSIGPNMVLFVTGEQVAAPSMSESSLW